MKAKVLYSDRLILKPLSVKHLSKEYVDWMNDNQVNNYLSSRGNYNLKILKNYLEEQEKKDILFWAIHLKKSNKHIGNIKIDPISLNKNSGEYGIMIGDKIEWGKGYAKEASKLVIKFCFNIIKLSEITLGVNIKNSKAINLYYGLGFIKEKEFLEKETNIVTLRMKIINGK